MRRGVKMPAYTKIFKNQKGITGLETAIVLIAFVIVASVLSYVIVSAGLFSSQKAKAAVNSGLEQSGATMELKSNVVMEMGPGPTPTTTPTPTPSPWPPSVGAYVYLTVGLVPGGSMMDLTPNPPPGWAAGVTPTPSGTPASTQPSQLIISYSDAVQLVPSLFWTVSFINSNNGDNILDPGELAQITVYLDPGWYPDFMSTGLIANATFTLNITPSDGSILTLERKLPSRVTGLINLQ